ncbi:MAG TPA: DUF503 domain-containing protein [Acidobacteria bacterium]|nr:DUF503 domain-containing protein [Acidobacteriota bacterium]
MHDDAPLYVAVARLEVHIPEARSLKAKRSVVRRISERVRSRHKVLAIEADYQDLYQRCTLAFSAISTVEADVQSRMERVRDTVDEVFAGMILNWDVEIVRL